MAQKVPRQLSLQEINLLLLYPAASFSELRTVTIIELFYATGIRLSELLGLQLENVNLEQGWVRVYGKGSKERIVPMHEQACKKLKDYLALRQEVFGGKEADSEIFVNKFGRKLSRVQVWKDLDALGRKTNLGKHLHPHLLRHSFASHLLQAGADLRALQEMLGHASLSTTQIYTHMDKAGLKNTHNRFHPRS